MGDDETEKKERESMITPISQDEYDDNHKPQKQNTMTFDKLNKACLEQSGNMELPKEVRYKLFEYFCKDHGLILTESEIDDIMTIFDSIKNKTTGGKNERT